MSEGIIQIVKDTIKSCIGLQNNHLKVCLTPEIRLAQALIDAGIENPAMLTKLTITGTLNIADCKYIRKKMNSSLQELDISKASIEENRIPKKAFEGCWALLSVIMPDTVTEIRKNAFGFCTGLTSIIIPNSVTEIGELAFYYCSGLTSIVIPNSVIKIRFRAFAKCASLISIVIPDSVIKIESGAFGECTGLTSLTLPDTDIEIGNYAFANCTSLTSFVIPQRVVRIGEGAFDKIPAIHLPSAEADEANVD